MENKNSITMIKKESNETSKNTKMIKEESREKSKTNLKRELDQNKRHLENNQSAEEPPFKLVRRNDIIGQNPSQMIQMLYNKKTKDPFIYSISLNNNGIHIYQIFKWASEFKMDFTYKHNDDDIIMYGYQFLEPDYNHNLFICNEEISLDALKECEKKQLIPYSNSDVSRNQPCKYDSIIKTIKHGKLSVKNNERYMNSIISTNVITYGFINDIILKMKQMKSSIKILDCYVDSFTENDSFEMILYKTLNEMLSK